MQEYHMKHADLAIAAIALAAAAALASAQAQTQTPSPEPTVWDHNGSVMSLVTSGSSREFRYQKPRQGMLEAGARPGSVLFRGEVNNGQFMGTAYIFNPHCGPIPFEAKGPSLDDERIVLTGEAPRVGSNCQTYGSYTSNLEFRRSKANETAQSQQPLAAAQPSASEVSKPETPSRSSGESAPTVQPSVKNETPIAAKDSSLGVTGPKPPSTPTDHAPVPNETAGTGLRNVIWGAAFFVMVVWLLIVLFGKKLITRIG